MRILTCLKIIPDLDQVPEADWASGASSGFFDFRGIKTILDPLSECGVELALRFRDAAQDAAVELEALTALPTGEDPKPAVRMLRTLAALGFLHTTLITDSPVSPAAPDVTAQVLADYCRTHGPYDLIVIGAQSADGGTGMTGLLLAEQLGLPCRTNVARFSPSDPTAAITAEYTRDGFRIQETVDTPVVLTIDDVPGALLRVPTLRQRKSAANAAPEEISYTENGADLPESRYALTGTALIDQSRSGVLIEGKDAAAMAARLYEDYLKGGGYL
ncbi:MAG: hypothetical protein IIZ43_04345 [Eubacterium sp.]|nr:hypothetical protein [Eubacterium sp.]